MNISPQFLNMGRVRGTNFSSILALFWGCITPQVTVRVYFHPCLTLAPIPKSVILVPTKKKQSHRLKILFKSPHHAIPPSQFTSQLPGHSSWYPQRWAPAPRQTPGTSRGPALGCRRWRAWCCSVPQWPGIVRTKKNGDQPGIYQWRRIKKWSIGCQISWGDMGSTVLSNLTGNAI